jgi:hypothetical protein
MPAWTSVMSSAAELTVGKHTAPSGSTAHPLVAEALARRTADAPRQEAAPGREGAVGWPGPPPGDSRVGWPAKDSAEAGTAEAGTAESADPRRGRRRFLRRVQPGA